MKKAGIITYNSAHNYGAVLQCYALQSHLESIGLDVEVINYRNPKIDRGYNIFKFKRTKSKWKNRYHALRTRAKLIIKQRHRLEKHYAFEHFINNALNTTKPYKNYRQLKQEDFDYDYMFCGSDQIWNTYITKGFDPSYFLTFGKKDAIKISYAASLGEQINPVFKDVYNRYIKELDYVSVREESMIDEFKNMTSRPVQRVLDPTLLLDRKQYDTIKKKTKYAGKDYIYVHYVGRTDPRVTKIAEELSKRTGLPILHNRRLNLFSNELAALYTEGPYKYLSAIENAKYVVSNSFHTTVFSIVYEKSFITIPHVKKPGRMKMLCELVGLENHLLGDVKDMPEDLSTLNIDYRLVKEKLSKEIEDSKEFINNAINNKRPNKHLDNYFFTKEKMNCYGCDVCKDNCPEDAITMVNDEEGFKYPQINMDRCIHCELCEKDCIYQNNEFYQVNNEYPKVFAAIHKEKAILDKSSSGGMFTPLYENMIKQGGYVIGVKYDENMNVIYDIASTIEECEKFRGSKYIKADINDVRIRVKELLDNGEKVLFSGNPCHIGALKKYLKKDYDNLVTVDIICHGVGSPKIFRKYLDYIENKYKAKITNFKFRDKINGARSNKSSVKIDLNNGKELIEPLIKNNLGRAYNSNLIQRIACYNCEFAGYERVSDITIGDYWGLQHYMPQVFKDNDNGISCISLNNAKGMEIFNKVKDDFNYYESNVSDMYKHNHKYPMVLSISRINLMKQIDDKDINELMQAYNRYKNKENSDPEIIQNTL